MFENLQSSEDSSIERISSKDLTYEDFFTRFMIKNVPVIIKDVGTTWECQKWIKREENRLDLSFLRSRIGNVTVPVANCSRKFFNSHEKSEMPFHEFLDYWSEATETKELLYLKDWHLKNALPDYDFYNVPEYFKSDFLNEFLIDRGLDDYRFVYMGRAGTWTPFHADVYSSFSWSVNIFGRKEWTFLPAGEELKLCDRLGNLPFEIDEKILVEKGVKYFKIVQGSNEAIFVPSNWHHQVRNLVDTVSINHNWFNGCNLHLIWKALENHMGKVEKEIEDCKEMEGFKEHCQVLLKASFGMNFQDFIEILEHVSNKRFEDHSQHDKFDLERIKDVLEAMKDHPAVISIELSQKCLELYKNIY